MTVNDLTQLDCREENNKAVLQWYLTKIKPLVKYRGVEDVPIDKILKVIRIISKRYNIRLKEVVPDMWSNDNETIWKAILIDENTLDIKYIYGISLYEVFAKTAIYMYSAREKVGERRDI